MRTNVSSLYQFGFVLIVVALILIGCASPQAASPAPSVAATPTGIPPTPLPTSVPPTATVTLIPPTLTSLPPNGYSRSVTDN